MGARQHFFDKKKKKDFYAKTNMRLTHLSQLGEIYSSKKHSNDKKIYILKIIFFVCVKSATGCHLVWVHF